MGLNYNTTRNPCGTKTMFGLLSVTNGMVLSKHTAQQMFSTDFNVESSYE